MQIIKFETLESQLFTLRSVLVLLDKDEAKLYEIEAKKPRQQLKRNLDKFPKDYAFQVSDKELDFMVSQNVTPSKKGGFKHQVQHAQNVYKSRKTQA